jgi:hypothetical protein
MWDDFTAYSGTSALQNNISTVAGGQGSWDGSVYKDGRNGSMAEIDKTVLYNGHQTLKYNQPGGTAATPELWAYLPNNHMLKKMWLRIKVRFSPGFTTYGITPGQSNAYKLFGWAWDGADGSARIEFTNTNQYVFTWGVTSSSNTMVGPAVETNDGPHVNSEWTDGKWYDYIIYYEQTSATTVRQRWWLAPDGQTPVLKGDISGSMQKGNVPLLNRVMFGLNFNSERPASESQAIWYGQWEVVDGSQYSDPFGIL